MKDAIHPSCGHPHTEPPPPGRAVAPRSSSGSPAGAPGTATSRLLGWLLLVAGAVVVGSMLGTKNLNSYDPGQAGQAERVLNRPGVVQRAAESVLIQARAAGPQFAADPQARQAIRQVAAALRACRGWPPTSSRRCAGGPPWPRAATG